MGIKVLISILIHPVDLIIIFSKHQYRLIAVCFFFGDLEKTEDMDGVAYFGVQCSATVHTHFSTAAFTGEYVSHNAATVYGIIDIYLFVFFYLGCIQQISIYSY